MDCDTAGTDASSLQYLTDLVVWLVLRHAHVPWSFSPGHVIAYDLRHMHIICKAAHILAVSLEACTDLQSCHVLCQEPCAVAALQTAVNLDKCSACTG